jgi:hypothetical protein
MDVVGFILTIIIWIIAIGFVVFLINMIIYSGGKIHTLISRVLGFKKR